jgi:hypothetical protein
MPADSFLFETWNVPLQFVREVNENYTQEGLEESS